MHELAPHKPDIADKALARLKFCKQLAGWRFAGPAGTLPLTGRGSSVVHLEQCRHQTCLLCLAASSFGPILAGCLTACVFSAGGGGDGPLGGRRHPHCGLQGAADARHGAWRCTWVLARHMLVGCCAIMRCIRHVYRCSCERLACPAARAYGKRRMEPRGADYFEKARVAACAKQVQHSSSHLPS